MTAHDGKAPEPHAPIITKRNAVSPFSRRDRHMPYSAFTNVELFRGVSQRALETISRLCLDRRYPRKATIFNWGDPSDLLFVLKEGVVHLCSVSEIGEKTILHILKPDAIFGELLFSEERRALTAIAGTDVLVTVITRKNLVKILRSIPVVTENLIRLLARRVAKVEKEFTDFRHSWSYNRLARVLLALAGEHGVETPNGTRITLRLTHEDLAKLIGTTRETVTTQINRFRRKGLVRREGGFLLVDRRKLSEFIQSMKTRTLPPAGLHRMASWKSL
jgi:CRP/FNR family cyclic AMP-dependent transcriptional regulator